jgi:hypothetical protein
MFSLEALGAFTERAAVEMRLDLIGFRKDLIRGAQTRWRALSWRGIRSEVVSTALNRMRPARARYRAVVSSSRTTSGEIFADGR